MHGQDQTHAEVLKKFRHDIFEEGIIHNGDTIGTDDETLLYVDAPHFNW